MAESKLTFQDILNQRRSSDFVGRQDELDFFRKNLSLSATDPERKFIVHISGQGGIGKTTLMKRFRAMAVETGFVAAMVDEWQEDVPQVLGEFAEQFAANEHKLESFAKRYKDYREKKGEVEADPEAPQGFAGFLGRTIAVGGVKMLRRTPVVGGAAELIDETALGDQVSEFASYLARKFKNKDEVELVSNPNEVLTPLFLENLKDVSEKHGIALFFDTFEKSESYLDQWLRDLLEGRFGAFPANIMFVIAGRDPLDQNWTAFEPLIHRIDLNPLSEPDAESYLRNHQITNAETIRVIMQLSGCIPLLLATLASQSPDDPAEVGDPSGEAVERFLKWVENPKQREAALFGAFPLMLNQNILEVIANADEASTLFVWLKKMPFVKQVKDGWVYHEVVRSQMLRYARKDNPQKWRELHQRVAAYFLKEKTAKESSAEGQERDLTIASDEGFMLYHQLCASPEGTLPSAMNFFLDALKVKRSKAKKVAEIINQAGTDIGSEKIETWGTRLLNGLNAYEKDNYPIVVDLFSDLLEFKGLDENKKAVGFGWRGDVYRLMGNYEAALKDFNRAIELDGKYKWAIARRGETYRIMDNYERALEDLNRAIELDEKSQFAIGCRALTYRTMKNYEMALRDFDRAIAQDEKVKWIIAGRGETHRLMKTYDAALKDFDRVFELDDKYKWAIASRGETNRLMENYDAALKDFNRSIELDEKYKWAIAHRGLTYCKIENYDNALRDFNRTIELDEKYQWAIAQRGEVYRLKKNYNAALKDLNRAVELDDKDHWAIGDRGLTYRAMKNYNAALQDFDRAIALDDKVAWVIAGRGETYRLMGNYEAALKDFNRAIELDEKYALAISRRGETYRSIGNYEVAIKDLNRAIELNTKDKWAIAHRGVTYRNKKNYEAALNDLNSAIEFDEKYQWAIAQRGETYRLMKSYENALKDFNYAIELDEKDQWTLARRGEAFRLMENYEAAIKDFNRAIELDGKDSWAIAVRGETNRLMKNYDAAIKDFSRAIELNEKYGWAIAHRGEALRLISNYDAAVEGFTRAIELNEKYEWAKRRRGNTYLLLNNYAKAIEDFLSVLASDPDNEWNYYLLGIAQKKDGKLTESIINLEKAINLGKNKYEKSGCSFREAFNLAIYYLAAGQTQAAYALYGKTIAAGATDEWLNMAIQDLEELLSIFCNEKEFETALAMIKAALSSHESNT